MKTGLENKVALITGGASGIGLASARALLEEGCRVVLADLRPEAALAELGALRPRDVRAVTGDISVPEEARRAVREAVECFGSVDVLVTSAGVYETTGVEMSDEEWERTLAINVTGTFMCARAAIAEMARHGWGRVITLSSMAAHTGGGAAGPAYVASKSAILGLTKSLAKHAGPHGVTVNAILPGFIETPMTGKIAAEDQEAIRAMTPLRRNGTAEDIAEVVVMLASEPARFITGAQINVNGGLVMH